MASPNTVRTTSKQYSDLYNTPEAALDRLFKKVDITSDKIIFEPCAGKGKIAEYLTTRFSCKVITNELEDHGYETNYRHDFLEQEMFLSENVDCIITNPPYKIAKEFILKGFEYCNEQYHFLRLSFLESKNRYEDLFKLGHLKTVYILTSRVSCSKGVEEEPQANAVAYVWLHFDKDFNGLPTIDWI